MKTEFNKEYIMTNKGCYNESKVNKLKCINNKVILINDLFDELPIKDFTWFLVKKCDLTLNQKRLFALHCAKQVLPIYEKVCPNDSRVRECIEVTELFINGRTSIDNLIEKRSAAYAAAYADAYAYVAYVAAYAAYAYADAAADAADAYADAYAAAGAADAAYKKSILEFIESIKNN